MSNGIVVIGRAERMGLGTMTQEFCEAFDPDRLVVIDCMNGRTVDPSGYKCGQSVVVNRSYWSSPDRVTDMLRGAKTVVGIETWYNDSVPDIARYLGVKSVMFPMWEWSSVHQCRMSDLLVCLSEKDLSWATQECRFYGDKCPRYDWPASPFVRQKCRRCGGHGCSQAHREHEQSGWGHRPEFMTTCDGTGFRRELNWPPKTFVHLAGNASHNREGTKEVLQSAKYLKGTGVKLRIHLSFKVPSDWRLEEWCRDVDHPVEFVRPVESRADLFAGCDCLVQPRRLPGHSLPINEAAGEGIPTIVLDLPDWKAWPYRVKAIPDGKFRARGEHDVWRADVDELGHLLRGMALMDVGVSESFIGDRAFRLPCPKLPTWAEFRGQWQKWMEQ